jgi:hypothetical protein
MHVLPSDLTLDHDTMQMKGRLLLRITIVCVVVSSLFGGIAISRIDLGWERGLPPGAMPISHPIAARDSTAPLSGTANTPTTGTAKAPGRDAAKASPKLPRAGRPAATSAAQKATFKATPKATPKAMSEATSTPTSETLSQAPSQAPAKASSTPPEAPANPPLKDARSQWKRSATDPPWHEPPNLVPLFTSDGRGLGTWTHNHATDAKFVWDSTLQDTVMQLTYGPWVVPPHKTYGPGTHLYHVISPADRPVRSIYLRTDLKLSPNWVQNPSNVLKIFELFSGEGESPIVGIYGMGANIRLMVANDNGHDPNYAGAFVGQSGRNVKVVQRPPDIFSLDQWHSVEVVIVANTPGVSDGRLKTWLDGRPQTDVSDVMWTTAGFKSDFVQFDINALWGGGEGTLVSPQYLWIGRIYLSGSRESIPRSTQ